MSKTNVFIYGSCVSRDTFEHFDPQHFELTQYVARQSALSAYTRPVEMVSPPQVASRFQQRMLTGDFQCSLQQLVPEAGPTTDLVLVDLVDERLGAYVLPDGSVITRSMELINSGAEQQLPEGSQHLPFGSEQHFQYWTGAIQAVGDMFRAAMPRAAVVLLDIPWAEWSETGEAAPDSFGITAQHANPIFNAYARVAAEALQARMISLDPSSVRSNANHPWGEAPFHYSESVYLDTVQQITGTPGRAVWGLEPPVDPTPLHQEHPSVQEQPASGTDRAQNNSLIPPGSGPDFIITGARHSGAEWFATQLAKHPDVFVAGDKGCNYFNRPSRVESKDETDLYLKALNEDPSARWRGDCTPEYFWYAPGGPFGPKRPNAAIRIKDAIDSDAPIFLVLRSPVARAVHAYWHQFSNGRIDPRSGVFRAPKNLGLIDQGFYARALRKWSSALGEGRLHVLLHDDLVDDAQMVLERSLADLGLTAHEDYWREVDLRPQMRLKSWLTVFQKQHPLEPQELAALVDVYRRDISEVEAFLQRELSQWRDVDGIVEALSK